MRVLAVSVILLAGGAWGQLHSYIDSEKDLLALPSDQLIHSDVELLAVESVPSHHPHQQSTHNYHHSQLPQSTSHLQPQQSTFHHLPFGARLPGFEEVSYAYGYTIPESIPAQQTSKLTKAGSDSTHQPSRVTHFSATLPHQSSDVSHFSSASNQQASKPIRVESKPLEAHLKPPNRDFDGHSSASQSLPSPQSSYLPPPPPTTTTTTTTQRPSVPSLDYLPPRTDPPTTTSPAPPPTSAPPSLEYLPPSTDPPPPSTHPPSEYLPPPPPPTPPTSEYLPPPPPPSPSPPPPPPTSTPPASEYLPPPPPTSPASPAPSAPPTPTPASEYLPPLPLTSQNLSPTILIPLSVIYGHDPPVGIHKPDPPLRVVEKGEHTSVTAGAEGNLNPLVGAIGFKKSKPLLFHAGKRTELPLRVTGHEESKPLNVIGEGNQEQVVGVVGHEEPSHIRFHAEKSEDPVFAVVGHEKPGHIRFHAEEGEAPVLSVVGHKEPSHIRFHAEEGEAPVLSVVGHEEPSHIRFHAEEGEAPVLSVVGHEEPSHIRFHAEEGEAPVLSVVGHEEPSHIRFHAEEGEAPVLSVVGHEEPSHIRFHAEEGEAPVLSVVGQEEPSHIRFHAEEGEDPVLSVVGQEEPGHIRFHAEEYEDPVLSVVGHEEPGHLKFHAEESESPVVGAIGHKEPSPVRFQAEDNLKSVFGVVGQHKERPVKFHKAPVSHLPYGLLSEIKENNVEVIGSPSPVVVGALVREEPDCKRNTDCSETEICLRGKCIEGCALAAGICVGHAVCRTKSHVPACLCLNMSTAVTLRRGSQERYDCMPMSMMGAGAGSRVTRRRVRDRTLFLRPQAIAVLRGHRHPQERVVAQGPVVSTFSQSSRPSFASSSRPSFGSSSRPSFGGTGNPCQPTPCGPNTRCEVNRNSIAQCRCIEDYVPDGNTINGCKPQCVSDGDCPDDHRCVLQKCKPVCGPGACGIGADCRSRNHNAVCQCPSGYRGNAQVSCTRDIPEIRVAPPAPPLDPCLPNPCGSNADCRVRGDRPVCTCPIGYEGDPLTNCVRGECIENRDCPGHRVCQRLRCIDPCQERVCGEGSECTVRNHQPICSCPRGFVGDPFTRCRRFDPRALPPIPCGTNTNCRVKNDRAVCSCIENYIGNPLSGCTPECVRDSDCSHNMACQNNICVNPCVDACGEGAYCDVKNSRAVCSCPEYYQGDPYRGCYAECTAHDDCPSYQACIKLQCVDPCDGSCGVGADCKVEDHKPICSCPKGYTGHPFESCRPFTREDLCNPNPCGERADCTPGFDRNNNDRPVCTCPKYYVGNPLVACQLGQCKDNNDCPENQACHGYMCQNPCVTEVGSVCGDLADCHVKNHLPVCSCPQGYSGNPLTECRIGRSGFALGRSKK